MRLSSEPTRDVENQPRKSLTQQRVFAVLVLCAAIGGVGVAVSDVNSSGDDDSNERTPSSSKRDISGEDSAPKQFPVTIRRPTGSPNVATGLTDIHGNAVTATCSTCHQTRQPNRRNRTTKDLDEFHKGMTVSHGNLSCLSCHNENDYDSLKLADGRRIEFSDVMTLCGQCHGPQMTAYEHGAHGGMTGYWDRSRGPQVKNNCIDCHPPHAPQFPRMRPTFKPRDRFLDRQRNEH